VEGPCAFFFRVGVKQSKKMKAGTRSFEISGTTQCCQIFWGEGVEDKHDICVANHGHNKGYTNV
jgi:hypothetical protein